MPSQENPSKSTLLIRPNRRALRQTPWRGHPHHSSVTDGSHEASGGLDKSPGKGLAGWGQLHRTGRENSLAGRPGKPGSSLGRDPVRLWEKVQPSHPTGLCPGGPGRGCVSGGHPDRECGARGGRRRPWPRPASLHHKLHPGSAIIASGTVKGPPSKHPFFLLFFFLNCHGENNPSLSFLSPLTLSLM